MQAIARFKLATSFPVGEEVTFEKVGEACGINATDARRILRHATIKNIFTEPRPGVIAHNAVSRLLAENPTLVDWVGASTDDLWQAASQTVNAMVKYPGSQEPNETVGQPRRLVCALTLTVMQGFCLANNTEKSMYLHLSDHPERARRFGSAMTLFTEGAAFDAKHVVDGYPWKDLGKSHVVDVSVLVARESLNHVCSSMKGWRFARSYLPKSCSCPPRSELHGAGSGPCCEECTTVGDQHRPTR